LVGEAATVAAVLAEVDRAVAGLQRGDLFIMTFAGHGALVEDYNGDQAPRKTDQAFCLFDRMLVDDEVVVRWGAFQPGVRVLILLDSCHSGTSPTAGAQLETKKRGAGGADDPLARLAARSVGSPAVPRVRALRSEQHTTANQVQEAELRAATSALDPAGAIERTRATILRIAACRADQTALEAGRHGLFTQTLIEIWNSGRFTGTYRDLVTQAGERTSPYQEPTLDYYGEEVQSFLRGQSFR
ncbi:caspase family protein, partial [bacterium]|nr:caspase family protein [bacterium]